MPEAGSPSAAENHARFGDVTRRLKQNLLGNDAPKQAVFALSGYVRLPTGGPLGAGKAEFGLALPFEYDFSQSLDVEVQMKGESRWDRTSAQRETHLNHSLIVDYRFGPAKRLEFFAEGAGF